MKSIYSLFAVLALAICLSASGQAPSTPVPTSPQTHPVQATNVVQLPVADGPLTDGSDPTADTNDPNMLRAQIVALQAMASDFYNRLKDLYEFKQYESALQMVQEKQKKVRQLTVEAQVKKQLEIRAAHPAIPPVPQNK